MLFSLSWLHDMRMVYTMEEIIRVKYLKIRPSQYAVEYKLQLQHALWVIKTCIERLKLLSIKLFYWMFHINWVNKWLFDVSSLLKGEIAIDHVFDKCIRKSFLTHKMPIIFLTFS